MIVRAQLLFMPDRMRGRWRNAHLAADELSWILRIRGAEPRLSRATRLRRRSRPGVRQARSADPGQQPRYAMVIDDVTMAARRDGRHSGSEFPRGRSQDDRRSPGRYRADPSIRVWAMIETRAPCCTPRNSPRLARFPDAAHRFVSGERYFAGDAHPDAAGRARCCR